MFYHYFCIIWTDFSNSFNVVFTDELRMKLEKFITSPQTCCQFGHTIVQNFYVEIFIHITQFRFYYYYYYYERILLKCRKIQRRQEHFTE